MTKINHSQEAFVIKLRALYDIEQQLEKALPQLEEFATDPELKEGFSAHLEETRTHIERLEKIFGMLGEEPKKTSSEGIRGIIVDGGWVMSVDAPAEIRDAMIASAARYAEHYEMAGYASAIVEAELLGLGEIEEILAETLAEEENADMLLEQAMRKGLEAANSEEMERYEE